ncbi:MAG: UDP-3-O-[3-hydroxymyristoyl] N-acetylglucosamine deacetylase, partial [Candidatus Omnitrophica bacterium CG12_big_fil_rev_8_21_14_0_65_50_5]
MKQKTLAKNVTLKGVGLHTGVKVQATFKPAETGSGIRFIRTDLNPRVEIKAAADCVKDGTAVSRCTSVASQEITIHTVEHAMSALAGLGISNAIIEINANELPGLDGSSLDYVKAFRKAGIV